MKRKHRQRLVSEINITPFTDVILVLLVIFMITTPLLSQSGLKVELPRASSAQPFGVQTQVTVTITDEGVYLEGKEANGLELKEKIGKVHGLNPDVQVILNIDRGVPFRNVVGVLDILGNLGIKDLNIATNIEK